MTAQTEVYPTDEEYTALYANWVAHVVEDSAKGPNWLRELSDAIDRSLHRAADDEARRQARARGIGLASKPVDDACAWCIMQASRGAVFVVEDVNWHTDCRCVLVDPRKLPPGFADAMWNIWTTCQARTKTGGFKETLAVMRREWPNLIGDGVFPKVPKILDLEMLSSDGKIIEPLSQDRWEQILRKHSPGGTKSDVAQQFRGMSSSEIARWIRDAIEQSEYYGNPYPVGSNNWNYRWQMPDGRDGDVALALIDGEWKIWTAFPANLNKPLRS